VPLPCGVVLRATAQIEQTAKKKKSARDPGEGKQEFRKGIKLDRRGRTRNALIRGSRQWGVGEEGKKKER